MEYYGITFTDHEHIYVRFDGRFYPHTCKGWSAATSLWFSQVSIPESSARMLITLISRRRRRYHDHDRRRIMMGMMRSVSSIVIVERIILYLGSHHGNVSLHTRAVAWLCESTYQRKTVLVLYQVVSAAQHASFLDRRTNIIKRRGEYGADMISSMIIISCLRLVRRGISRL